MAEGRAIQIDEADSVHLKQAEMKNASTLLTKMTHDFGAVLRHPSREGGAKVDADTKALAAQGNSFRTEFQYDLNKQNSSALVSQGIIPRLDVSEAIDASGNPEDVSVRGSYHPSNGGRSMEYAGQYQPFFHPVQPNKEARVPFSKLDQQSSDAEPKPRKEPQPRVSFSKLGEQSGAQPKPGTEPPAKTHSKD
jgi:hypothetical protein